MVDQERPALPSNSLALIQNVKVIARSKKLSARQFRSICASVTDFLSTFSATRRLPQQCFTSTFGWLQEFRGHLKFIYCCIYGRLSGEIVGALVLSLGSKGTSRSLHDNEIGKFNKFGSLERTTTAQRTLSAETRAPVKQPLLLREETKVFVRS
jgi:hypothetical protein